MDIMMRKPFEVGEKHGRLTAIAPREKKHNQSRWLYQCECGAQKVLYAANVRSGRTISCGCAQRESQYRKTNHGGPSTPTYKCWQRMIDRCYNPRNPSYSRYGGRGITVCDQWRNSYQSFLDDIGERPSPDHSPDRIDNDGHYSPGNVRWASRSLQAINRKPRSTSGIAGVSMVNGRWQVSLRHNGKRVYYGYFADFFEACCVRKSAENATLRH